MYHAFHEVLARLKKKGRIWRGFDMDTLKMLIYPLSEALG